MITLEKEFQSNANQCGLHTFKQIKQGKTPNGKNVYIYERRNERKIQFYEVVVPVIIKKGTIQRFPNGTTKTVEDDTEMYPGASSFGRNAYNCINIDRANIRFNQFTNLTQDIPDEEIELERDTNKLPKTSKIKNESILIPDNEFSTTELAEYNKISYPLAFLFLKEQLANGTIKFVRKEQRNAKGKATSIFSKK